MGGMRGSGCGRKGGRGVSLVNQTASQLVPSCVGAGVDQDTVVCFPVN